MELKRRNFLTLAGSVILSNFTIPLDLNAGTKNYSAISVSAFHFFYKSGRFQNTFCSIQEHERANWPLWAFLIGTTRLSDREADVQL